MDIRAERPLMGYGGWVGLSLLVCYSLQNNGYALLSAFRSWKKSMIHDQICPDPNMLVMMLDATLGKEYVPRH
jgi:hypothetical protein